MHIGVLIAIILLLHMRIDPKPLIEISAYTIAAALLAYAVFIHCIQHPKKLFKNYDRWMIVFLVSEYVGYMFGLAVIFRDLSLFILSAFANAGLTYRSWGVYTENKRKPETMGTDKVANGNA